ncbi:MAG: pilus assembly protein PilP [Lautropia sp.]|nr:pilus assembly protein PilP [Lautropia sp.]
MNKPMKRLGSATGIVLMSVGLAACSPNLEEVQGWMDETRANTPRRVGKLDEPKMFVPFRYEAKPDYDPFSDSKLEVAMANLADRSSTGLKPDLNRRREVLESYPLDTVRLVGHMNNQSNGAVGLLAVGDVVYPVRVGNYVGQNFGRIVSITETEMGVKELVRDAAGDWVEQKTLISLQEESKP